VRCGKRQPLLDDSTFLVVGFGVAVWLRVAVGGASVARSGSAGLVFAGALFVLTLAAGVPARPDLRSVGWGVAGAVVLCVPPLLLAGGHRPGGAFLPWAAIVTVVAVAEEAFLRGALYESLVASRSQLVAVAVTSVCFAALHVPLYGWQAVPLDLAVGLWLGTLRQVSGNWTAPATAHVLADLAGWWLR
jgi:membrane protease YdiL (CAAX protease family)